MKNGFLLTLVLLFFISCKEQTTDRLVQLSTPHGNIKIKLYDETPLHRDNFIRLVKEGFYDGILFHRVIDGFMIQAGDPDSKGAAARVMLGEESHGENIEAEILPRYFHRKGVLAAAREGDQVNPERKSSGSHFYLVQGKVYTPEELKAQVERINESRRNAIYNRLRNEYREEYLRLEEALDLEGLDALSLRLTEACDKQFASRRLELNEEQQEAYTTVGGTPHLDGEYTVFGEVVEGLDVIDKIAAQKTDLNDRPLKDIPLKAKILR